MARKLLAKKRYNEKYDTYIAKLYQPELAEFGDTGVSSFALEKQLTQCHFLAAEERAHL